MVDATELLQKFLEELEVLSVQLYADIKAGYKSIKSLCDDVKGLELMPKILLFYAIDNPHSRAGILAYMKEEPVNGLAHLLSLGKDDRHATLEEMQDGQNYLTPMLAKLEEPSETDIPVQTPLADDLSLSNIATQNPASNVETAAPKLQTATRRRRRLMGARDTV